MMITQHMKEKIAPAKLIQLITSECF